MVTIALGWLLVVQAEGALVSTEDPAEFFQIVAGRLLQSELGLALDRIQIYPTNQYSAAVHRLLQLTANIYDCTTNRPLTDYPQVPTVFRPLFTNENGAVLICGYAEETGTNILGAALRDLHNAADRALLRSRDMVIGVPAIIGAKKGFPNFNELALETGVSVGRKLEFRRALPSGPINETNVMYTASISNNIGIEAWNSYINPFPRNLLLLNSARVTTLITDELKTVLVSNACNFGGDAVVIPSNSWTGFAGINYPQVSLMVPCLTNFDPLVPSAYSASMRAFVPATNFFERLGGQFAVPLWWLTIRVTLVFALVDADSSRIVDYANLDSTTGPLFLTDILQKDTPDTFGRCDYPYIPNGSDGSVWCTNRYPPTLSLFTPTMGMLNQIRIGLDDVASSSWPPATNYAAIDFFRCQLDRSPLIYPPGTFSRTNLFYCPFVPLRKVYFFTSWQANDPLLHHTVSELLDQRRESFSFDFSGHNSPVANIGNFNERYRPWGSLPTYPPFARELGVKDPLVSQSDAWRFPTNQSPGLSWLGQVHRGTPWQTVYWKSRVLPESSWTNWVYCSDANEAACLHPTNDWHLAEVLAPLFNTNFPHALPSMNQSAAGWSAVLDGITAFTNPPASPLQAFTLTAGSPIVETIASALERQQADEPAGYYHSIADVLKIPELSLLSPCLNLANSNSVTDAAYEAVPSQLLARVRPDSIGTVDSNAGVVQFSGLDNYSYVLEFSSNLLQWAAVSTNRPQHGAITIPLTQTNSVQTFFRSVLLP